MPVGITRIYPHYKMSFLKFAITTILTSLYLFPFHINGVPGNTKTILAVGGLLVLGYELARKGSASFNKNLSVLSLLAALVSMCGFVSIAINNTSDYAYACYIMSMWVWLGAAYFVIKTASAIHGGLNITLLCNYLIAVCMFQCIMSILIDRFDDMRTMVDTYIEQGQDFLKSTAGVKRKYGIGASLDVAGSRFSAVLAMIAIFITRTNDANKPWLCITYILCFIFVSVQGNAIARTTTVGMIFGLIWLVFYFAKCVFTPDKVKRRFISVSLTFSVFAAVSTVYLFHTDKQFRKDIRFGFEGFFSLVEKGKWEVSSNEKLRTMIIWPDNPKTWLIGDGYFSNPTDTDPYFNGVITGGYYMGTDVGYLRFIFYFGLVGLFSFCALMCYSAVICMKSYKQDKILFIMILMINFVVWLKVSTDLFVVFAPFLALSAIKDNQTEEKQIKSCG